MADETEKMLPLTLKDREQRIQTICLMVLSAILGAAALFWLRPILIPFILALLFSLALAPLVESQMRHLRMPNFLAVLSSMLILSVVMMLIGGLVSSSLSQLSQNSEAYQHQIGVLVSDLREAIPFEKLGLDEADFDLASLSAVPSKTVGRLLVGPTNAILDLVSLGFVVLIFPFFLLAGSTANPTPKEGVRGEIESRIKSYILAQGLLSAATGLLVGVILVLLGVDLALVFGLFAFLLNFIPNVGSIIAILLPLPVVLVSPDIGTSQAILAIALPAVVQIVIGNVIAPKVLGEAVDLNPVVILLALMFWGALWGIVGMLLATPITSILKILMSRFDVTAPLARALSGSRT
jgi:AI-2 transport protein TqsA